MAGINNKHDALLRFQSFVINNEQIEQKAIHIIHQTLFGEYKENNQPVNNDLDKTVIESPKLLDSSFMKKNDSSKLQEIVIKQSQKFHNSVIIQNSDSKLDAPELDGINESIATICKHSNSKFDKLFNVLMSKSSFAALILTFIKSQPNIDLTNQAKLASGFKAYINSIIMNAMKSIDTSNNDVTRKQQDKQKLVNLNKWIQNQKIKITSALNVININGTKFILHISDKCLDGNKRSIIKNTTIRNSMSEQELINEKKSAIKYFMTIDEKIHELSKEKQKLVTEIIAKVNQAVQFALRLKSKMKYSFNEIKALCHDIFTELRIMDDEQDKFVNHLILSNVHNHNNFGTKLLKAVKVIVVIAIVAAIIYAFAPGLIGLIVALEAWHISAITAAIAALSAAATITASKRELIKQIEPMSASVSRSTSTETANIIHMHREYSVFINQSTRYQNTNNIILDSKNITYDYNKDFTGGYITITIMGTAKKFPMTINNQIESFTDKDGVVIEKDSDRYIVNEEWLKKNFMNIFNDENAHQKHTKKQRKNFKKWYKDEHINNEYNRILKQTNNSKEYIKAHIDELNAALKLIK